MVIDRLYAEKTSEIERVSNKYESKIELLQERVQAMNTELSERKVPDQSPEQMLE